MTAEPVIDVVHPDRVRLVFEPGRLITGNAGVLLTRLIRTKPGATYPFLVVDAAMNDLMRPALYDAWHQIDAVAPRGGGMTANVVGPVCETGDTFALAREMDAVEPGDLLVFRTAGAYAAAMSSTYNSRPLTPEVLVDGNRWAVVRPRVDIESLIAQAEKLSGKPVMSIMTDRKGTAYLTDIEPGTYTISNLIPSETEKSNILWLCEREVKAVDLAIAMRRPFILSNEKDPKVKCEVIERPLLVCGK